VTGAILVALVGARNHAGGWNDGSRLATVECLVDYHTLAIDRSVFVLVPRPAGMLAPYGAVATGLLEQGTKDKLAINGHYYSDKSPVPAVLLAGAYWVWSRCTGLTARDRPDWFCYLMTLACSGSAYVVAVWCVFRLGGLLGLTLRVRFLLTASFALATVTIPYAEYVNNHILLLGVVSALALALAASAAGETESFWRLVGLGALAGLGYTIDLGTGPVLLVCTLALVAYRGWHRAGSLPGLLTPLVPCLLGALPWLVLHHALNYAVGGTWVPANAVAEYLRWPGCPFTPQTMTGGWKHDGPGSFLLYAAALLLGKRGFLVHNLPLLLAVPALVLLLWRRVSEWPELLWSATWAAGTWLLYAANSNNYSGACCSVRWFVPLLAPGYYTLAVWLKHHSEGKIDLLLLTVWGGLLAIGMAWCGPWTEHMVPFLWPVVGLAVVSWFGYRLGRRTRRTRQVRLISGRFAVETAERLRRVDEATIPEGQGPHRGADTTAVPERLADAS
jgi:hypothetical protein